MQGRNLTALLPGDGTASPPTLPPAGAVDSVFEDDMVWVFLPFFSPPDYDDYEWGRRVRTVLNPGPGARFVFFVGSAAFAAFAAFCPVVFCPPSLLCLCTGASSTELRLSLTTDDAA